MKREHLRVCRGRGNGGRRVATKHPEQRDEKHSGQGPRQKTNDRADTREGAVRRRNRLCSGEEGRRFERDARLPYIAQTLSNIALETAPEELSHVGRCARR